MGSLPQVLVNGLVVGGVYALVAIGYTLVYGVLRLINFAHGGIFTLGAFSTLALVDGLGLSLLEVAPLVLIIGVITGVTIERLAYRPVRGAPILVQLITALGVATIIENTIAAIFGSDAKSLPPALVTSQVIEILGIRLTTVQIVTILLSIVLLIGLWWLVMYTSVGRKMRAAADDAELAATSGINVNKIISSAFAVGSGLGAVAGMVVALDVGCDPYMGTMIGFKAFAACVIGGIGSLRGAVVGGFIIGLFENVIAGYVSTEYKSAIVMAVLIVLLLFRPSGLFIVFKERTV